MVEFQFNCVIALNKNGMHYLKEKPVKKENKEWLRYSKIMEKEWEKKGRGKALILDSMNAKFFRKMKNKTKQNIKKIQ